jgi:uncharacterized membrane protein
MVFSLLKLLHILFAITAVGSNITYGVWQRLAGNSPEHEAFVLRGIKFLDNRVANPAYGLLLVTGLIMAFWHWSITTRWIVAAIILYVVLIAAAVAFYSPALSEQIQVIERDGPKSPAYQAASRRATLIGAGLFIPVLGILFMMVVKPAL